MINTAGASELHGLYGIGPALAARIIAFRDRNGSFAGPDDLARVDGIGVDLALVLAPHIDWRVSPEDDANDEHSKFATGFAILILGACAVLIPGVADDLRQIVQSRSPGWEFRLWARTSFLLALTCGVVTMSWLGLSTLTTSKRRYMAYTRSGNRWNVAALVSLASLGLANAARYTFLAPGGWHELFRSSREVLTLVTILTGVGVGSQALIVSFRPDLAKSRGLELLSIVSYVIMLPGLAAWIWVVRGELPLWLSLFYAVVGVVMVWSGIVMLRGFSPPGALAERLRPGSAAADTLWLRWINARLPDPEQQKSLLQALERVHPPSRWRTLRGVAITGAGTWLVVATASAVWEWLVQNWLDSGFGGP